MLDITIILVYFAVVMGLGLYKRVSEHTDANEFFLNSRSLKWPSIAISTIATNIHANHFLGMAGAAYLYGLAQANMEINAITGILIAAFLFVPLYLKEKVSTISGFFAIRLGERIALTYAILMIILYSFVFLGSMLFLGAYAVNAVFPSEVAFIHQDPMTRIFIIAIFLGGFSAVYTYFGGMGAVVRTDIIQFVLLLGGGVIMLYLSMKALGGWEMLYRKTPELMHLHLPADHPTLPWPALVGIFLLNFNYWGANQVILQRALAAKNLFHAQLGLVVGGFLKYLMAAIIILPAIALAGLHAGNPLADPDMAYPEMVNLLLPAGLKGIILCGLFASLMSSVDSTYHSVSTLWSLDIYKKYIRREANDQSVVAFGRKMIFFTMAAGLLFAWINAYVKFDNPDFALTHWFNEMTYYVKNGFVFLILCAVFLINPSKKLVFYILLASIAITVALKYFFPEMNYFNRSTVVILMTTLIVAIPAWMRSGWHYKWKEMVTVSRPAIGRLGVLLLLSLIAVHVLFH
ncbi:MAG: sodium/solute symporter [Gammaproteobacteria bacterium]|nr:sodium/solute symporter [Gammaproteobacteria bacterium]